MEKKVRSSLERFNQSEDLNRMLHDDIIVLAHGEPIIKGKQGEILL